jgi:hypothetical protein
MMKRLLSITLLLFSFESFSWETKDCEGKKEDRIKGLEHFGRKAQEYISEHGYLPDLSNVHVPKLEHEIPPSLQKYLVCGGSDEGEVHYWCFSEREEKREVTEVCYFNLNDSSIRCQPVTMEYDH